MIVEAPRGDATESERVERLLFSLGVLLVTDAESCLSTRRLAAENPDSLSCTK
jgi:hypothetical protein